MKSNRAEELILLGTECYEVTTITAEQAVELAEEDMADKAAKAFCALHCPKGCPFDNSEECNSLREFKQKMME